MFMDFAPVQKEAMAALSANEADINWLYTIALLAAVPGIIAAMAVVDKFNWSTYLLGTSATVASAWVRYVAVHSASLQLALVSSVLLGLGQSTVFVGFSELPARWFPDHSERAFASAIVVQLTFAGWGVGSIAVASIVKSVSLLSSFCFWQAIVVSASIPIYLFTYPSRGVDKSIVLDIAQSEETSLTDERYSEVHSQKTTASLRDLFCSPRYVALLLATGLLQGVGFTAPAVQEPVFLAQGYKEFACDFMAFACIMAGVFFGLFMGRCLAQRDESFVRRVVIWLFWLAPASLLALVYISHQDYKGDTAGLYYLELALMSLVGFASLGFINIALPLVCEAVPTVPESRSGGLVELTGLAMGAVLTQLSTGRQFIVCLFASFAAAVLSTAFCVRDESEFSESSDESSECSSVLLELEQKE